MRDLAGAIISARRTYEAAVGVRAARLSAGDRDMVRALEAEVDAQFKLLATHLGYLVESETKNSEVV